MIVKRGKISISGLLVLILLSVNTISAQPRYLQLKQFTSEDGLSSSTITCISQDFKGFIWIGTRNGLNRFDGNTFKIYKADNEANAVNTLPDNLVLDICFDVDNRLYVGTMKGLSLYQPQFDNFHNYQSDSNSCLYNVNFQARSVTAAKDGTLYIASTIGVICFNPKQNTYSCYNEENGLCNSVIDKVFLANDNRLWIGTTSGLDVLNIKTGELKHIGKGLDGTDYSSGRFHDIIADQKGVIWASSYTKGLFRVALNDEGEECLQNFKHEPGNSNSISANRLMCIEVDKSNNIWVGAENDGVYCLNPNRNRFKHYLSAKADPFLTKTYSGECLFFDRSDNLWVGTFANGLNLAPKNSGSIVAFNKFKGGDLSNTNNMVNAFYQQNDSLIWVATDGGGINILNKNTGYFRCISTENSDLPTNYILSIDEGKNGEIWMSTWGSGLVCYRPEDNSYTVYDKTNSSIPDNNLFDVCVTDNGALLIATFSSGLAYFEPYKNIWKVYDPGNSKLAVRYINAVKKLDNQTFVIGTNSGVFLFNSKSETITELAEKEQFSGIEKAHVYDVFVESKTSVWAATLSGLVHFNPKTGDNKTFTVKNGLPNNSINGVLKDENGLLWFSTLGGICSYNLSTETIEIYNKHDGLQSNEFRPRSLLSDSNGHLYFGGINGFSIVYPEKLKKNSQAPVVSFTGFEIFNKPVLPNTLHSPLQRIISEEDELRIPASKSVLTFHFGVLDYAGIGKTQHAYKLENFDKDWTYCGTRRQVTYTNLDPGKYVLRVKGANSDGVWNEEGVALTITIIPPWWKTLWFMFLILILFIGIFLFVNHLRIASLEQQKQKLEIAVKQRTKELAEINTTKDKLFAVIAHDLRNPFNVILGYTDVLIEGYKKFDQRMMDQILDNLKTAGDSAFALLENLMNWSRSQRGVIEFLPKQALLCDFIETALLEIEALAIKKNIALINCIESKNANLYIDFNMMLLVFRNLLTNAVKFSNQGGKIYLVEGAVSNNYITLGIKDEGIGIDPERMEFIFQPGKQETTPGTKGEKGSGLGLMLCKEFVEKHSGEIWVESTPGEGAVFWLTLPLYEDYIEKKETPA
ncbi:sensor histidine kinase [uncultured Draconibacterium sp.]|uniref:ligand-binding sensor domain-containing protein n=1 Tax=uncultured Draconibacterium sp. TaxID=1573823 RepID=UPI0025EDDF44|nr:sensor histidine kinase [uncultured Draconibacterium sp.]